MVLAHRFLPSKPYDVSKVAFVVALVVASLGFAMLTLPVATRMIFLSVVLVIHLGVFWAFLLSQDERAFLRAKRRLK
jgi:hypothetical protein